MLLSRTVFVVTTLLPFFLIFGHCQSPAPAMAALLKDGSITYDLSNPSEKWVLPGELVEISGLSYTPSGRLACIQDENGILYLLNFKEQQISEKIPFGKNGDYEGVEMIDDTVFVLRSDGKLFAFKPGTATAETDRIKTGLSEKNNTEGLAYDPVTRQLLIACKGDAERKKEDKIKGSAIYGFDVAQRKLSKSPLYLIRKKHLKESLIKNELNPEKHDAFRFSGIAVHPLTKQIYCIGTIGKLLIILNRDGRISTLAPLKRNIFLQPEGICFDPGGNLYISSEGRSGRGYILKFTPGQAQP